MNIYEQEVAKYLWRNVEIIRREEATIHVNAVGHASIAGIFERLFSGNKLTAIRLQEYWEHMWLNNEVFMLE